MGTMVDFYGKKQLRAVEAPKGDGNDIPPAEKQSLSAQTRWLRATAITPAFCLPFLMPL
jgi:hypothetical protein